MVIFEVFKDTSLPAHSHLGQWGSVIEGLLELTIDGETEVFQPGDSYNIPSGVMHTVKVCAGFKLIDLFEDPERYPLRT
ncbi:MAG: quercetin dioxygenase-like cupin family protein [bacterium]|jgi:quercetin dioxygenase-like cupin family protein